MTLVLFNFHFIPIVFDHFSDFSEIDVEAVIDNPKQLRNDIIFWAIQTGVTDLVETFPPIVENFKDAKIKPDALTSNDVLDLAFNPRKAICQGQLLTQVIVSENISKDDFEVMHSMFKMILKAEGVGRKFSVTLNGFLLLIGQGFLLTP